MTYHVCRFDGLVAIPVHSFSELDEAKEYAESHAGDFCSGLEILNERSECLDWASGEWKDEDFVLVVII